MRLHPSARDQRDRNRASRNQTVACCAQAAVEQLEQRTMLSGGPQVRQITPLGEASAPFDRIEVSFSEPVQASSFDVDDVELSSEGGTIAASAITALAADRFEIDFGGLTGIDVYTLRIGPEILADSGEAQEDVYLLTLIGADTAIAEADLSFDGGALLIHAADVTLAGSHSFGQLRLATGSTLTIAGGTATTIAGLLELTGNSTIIAQGLDTGGQVNGAWAGQGVTITATDVVVEAGSSITADAQGYAGYTGYGDGRGPGGGIGESGGTHGGVGGNAVAEPITVAIYGDATAPTQPGSAGAGGFWGTGGSGGGAISLDVSGTLELDGRISADGQSISGQNGGGGAGGSIFVTAGTLSGSGIFSADGGSNLTHRGGGGGGGRIAVRYANDGGFDFGGSTAAAGTGSGFAAQAGTVAFADTTVTNGHLQVHQNFVVPADTVAHYGAITVGSGATLTIGGGSAITVDGAFNITGNSTVIVQGKNIGGMANGAWAGQGASIAAGSMFVESGSHITADAQGHVGRAGTSGLGPGAWDYTTDAGGAHGGRAGGSTGNPIQPYGDAWAPTTLGSAGGGWLGGTGGSGGGAIQLTIAGILRLDGQISADGQTITSSQGLAGGGSGGSIHVQTDSLIGTGGFIAIGGTNPFNQGGGGSGGRIAVYYDSAEGYTGFAASSVAGGSGNGRAAEAGTMVFVDRSVANHHLQVHDRFVLPPDTDATFGAITLADGGALIIGGGSTITVDSAISITGNSTIIAQAKDIWTTVNGEWVGRGVSIIAESIVVEAGSSITADGQGYAGHYDAPGAGPGASDGTNNAGGSHGGLGGPGGSAHNTSTLYGDPLAPMDLGSAGGFWNFWTGASGGGAIHLRIDGALRIDGTISANGASLPADIGGGAGAGGSVYIAAGSVIGEGVISADGGDAQASRSGGGGGGGRIAIHAGVWSASAQVHANGGNGYNGGNGGGVGIYTPSAPAMLPQLTAEGGTGPAGAGTAGTAAALTTKEFLWTGDVTSYLHDTETLSWMGVCVDPSLELTDIIAVRGDSTCAVATGVSAIGAMTWDTRGVPDGVYELLAIFRDSAGAVGTARRSVLVDNAAQWHSGTISANETWPAGVLHLVEADVTIAPGATVTVEPGAVAKFAPDTKLTIGDGGTLQATGAEGQPILFTSILDDTAGGATNSDPRRLMARPGDWRGFTIQGTGQLNLNQHTEQRYMRIVHSGTISASETWQASALHSITGNVTIASGVTLTIEPGAVIRFDANCELNLAPGSQFLAQGTVAQPIRFTSYREDDSPAAGDWRWVHADGATAILDHVDMRYGGGNASQWWDGTGMLRTSGAASLTVTNSVLRDAFYDGILVWGGEATIQNTVVAGADRGISAHPDSVVHVINATVDDNRIGILGHGGALDIANSIVSNSLAAGIQYDFGPLPTLHHNNVWAGAANAPRFVNMPDPTGQNGNIAADPRYRNAADGDYRLRYGSPAIDAADGAAASASDLAGSPRYDDPRVGNTGIASAGGEWADMGAFEFVESADSNIDLGPSNVNGPAAATAGQSVTVTWTVTNRGSVAVDGPWHDSIGLAFGGSIVKVADVLVASGVTLIPGQSINLSATVTVPGALPTDYLWRVESNTRNDLFEGNNRGNNAALSARTIALDLPLLEVGGAAIAGTFTAQGQTAWYKIIPAAGQDTRIQFTAAAGGFELYAARGSLPTLSQYDFRSVPSNSPTLAILSPGGEPWYVIAHARTLDGVASFTIDASESTFSLNSVSPSTMGNSGPVTLRITGGQLAGDAAFQLVSPAGIAHAAASVTVQDSTTVYATFNLFGAAAGAYDLRVVRGESLRTLNDAVLITAVPAVQSLETSILLPLRFRANRPFTGHIVYRNTGTTDIAAPILILSASGQAGLRLGDGALSNEDLILVGASFDGPAGILRAGEQWQIPFSALATTTAELQFQLSYKMADSADAVDWAGVAAQVRPANMDDIDWQPLWQHFTTTAGPTWGGFVQVMATHATAVGQSGGVFYSAQEVFRAALLDSYATSRTSASGIVRLNGQPLADAMLVLSTSDGAEAGVAVSKSDGSFRFLSLPAGTYTLRVRDYLLAEPVQVTIPPGSAATGLSISVTRGGSVSGTVRRGSDGSRLADASITLHGGGRSWTLTTDPTGDFRFSGLPDGSYELVAGGGEWETQRRSAIAISSAAAVNGLDFQLAAGGAVAGHVLAGAVPLAGASISLVGADGSIFSQPSSADGAYSIGGVSSGEYELKVFADGYGPLRTLVHVASGNVTTLGDLSLAAAATLSVSVNHEGSPIAHAIVQLLRNGQQVDISTLDDAGAATFTNLAAGEYVLSIRAEGFDDYSAPLTLAAGQTLSPAIILNPTADPEGAFEGVLPIPESAFLVASPGAIAAGLTAMFRQYLEDHNPEPQRHPEDNFPALPSANWECPAAVEAWRDAVFLADSKRTAWDRWTANHESFNTTVWTSASIAATQATTFVGSIIATLVSGGVTAELQAASGAVQGSMVALQFIQMAQSLISLTEGVIGNLDAMAAQGELSVDSFVGMFNDLAGQAGGVVGMIDTIETIGGVDGGSIAGNFANALGMVGSFVSLILGTIESARQFVHQANTVVDGEAEYLNAFAQYKAARAALSSANENCDEKPEPEKSPKPGNTSRGAQGNVPSGTSVDPNDKQTIGVGQAGYIRPGQMISYLINFENQPSATLPAQLVTITDPLDAGLDWSTLQLTGVGFNGTFIEIPAGRAHFETVASVATDPNPVRITIALDPATGVLTWRIESFDPITGLAPEDPLAGFLAPNNGQHQGEGFVTFTIKAKASLGDGATIINQARIVFDDNAPIDTNLTLNTIDSRAPQSSVIPLPSVVGPAQFAVSWAGHDSAAAGVAGYDVYVSAAGGPYALWLGNTSATSALFAGQPDVAYAFHAVARDRLGNVEAIPLTAQATTIVDAAAPTAKLARLAGVKTSAKTYRFTVTYSDNFALDARSVNTRDILVLGPRKFKQYAKLVSARPANGGRTVKAIYQITAPGKRWDPGDAGSYSLWLNAGQVTDSVSNPMARRRLGILKVKGSSRTRKASAAPVTAAPRQPAAARPDIFSSRLIRDLEAAVFS